MKLFELLLEYGSSNPFIGIMSAIDLRVREVNVAIHAGSSKIFNDSLKRQLEDLLKFLESGSNWVIPEPKLRADIHAALPLIKKHVSSAVRAAATGNPKNAKEHLMTAREITIKRSHLTFGSIE